MSTKDEKKKNVVFLNQISCKIYGSIVLFFSCLPRFQFIISSLFSSVWQFFSFFWSENRTTKTRIASKKVPIASITIVKRKQLIIHVHTTVASQEFPMRCSLAPYDLQNEEDDNLHEMVYRVFKLNYVSFLSLRIIPSIKKVVSNFLPEICHALLKPKSKD